VKGGSFDAAKIPTTSPTNYELLFLQRPSTAFLLAEIMVSAPTHRGIGGVCGGLGALGAKPPPKR